MSLYSFHERSGEKLSGQLGEIDQVLPAAARKDRNVPITDDAAEDRFARFLIVLTEHLDDREISGADLAAKLFVSRSLLDRLVAATAGETTARLRRRLLLERAAYQLRTSASSVLDVAVDAGYSSNEAFTRAFQRAYGTSPRQWRSSAAAFILPAPNGVHFYPPGGLRLPGKEKAISMFLAADMIDQHIAVLGQLLDRSETLTRDQLDAPIEINVQGIDDNPTIRSLLSRLVGQLAMWNASMASEPYDFAIEQDETIDSMRTRLVAAGPAFAHFVRGASEQDRLGEIFVDATCSEPNEFTFAGMVGHVLTYAAYRRTLVVGALASAGAPDVEDDPLVWFRP
jgi:AraC-like DNA-binding protein